MAALFRCFVVSLALHVVSAFSHELELDGLSLLQVRAEIQRHSREVTSSVQNNTAAVATSEVVSIRNVTIVSPVSDPPDPQDIQAHQYSAVTLIVTVVIVIVVCTVSVAVVMLYRRGSFSGQKTRVLCLHSFRMSGEIMQEQLFGFSDFGEKLEEAGLSLTYLDAPYKCTPEDEAKIYPKMKEAFGHFGAFYEWYTASEDGREYRRLEETLTYLEHVMESQGPFDGIVGFSQGGSLAHLVAYLQSSGERFTKLPPLKFIVVLNSRRSRAAVHDHLWETSPPKSLPKAFVVYGGKDTSIFPEEAKRLIDTLPGATEVYLPQQAHSIPSLRGKDAQALATFLKEFVPTQ